jgi:CBS domain-containing protein
LFGHGIYFHGELKDYGAEAEEDCLIWHLAEAEFAKLRERNPLLSEYFSSHLKTRLSAAAQVQHSFTQMRDLQRRQPVTIDCNASIREAAKLMSDKDVSSVLVMRGPDLVGIVTDKDLRVRVLAADLESDTAIERVMTKEPTTLSADAGADAALLLMMRENYHHLPIVEDGKPLGLVTAGDILRSQSEHPLRLVRDIHKKKSVDELVVIMPGSRSAHRPERSRLPEAIRTMALSSSVRPATKRRSISQNWPNSSALDWIVLATFIAPGRLWPGMPGGGFPWPGGNDISIIG